MKDINTIKPKPSSKQPPMPAALKRELIIELKEVLKEKGYECIMNDIHEEGVINVAVTLPVSSKETEVPTESTVETRPVSSIKSGVATDSVEEKPSGQVEPLCSEPNTHRGCFPISLLCCRLFKKQPTQTKSHNETNMVQTLEMSI